MRTLLMIFFIGTLAVSCAPQDNSQASIAIVKQYLDAVDNNDFETMESLLADDYLGLGPSIDDSTNKELAVASWKWNVENLYESIDFDRTQTFATTIGDGPNAGDWAYNWAQVTIKYKDIDETVDILVNAVYKIENGKIARTRTFYNEADVLNQLGFRIAPPIRMPKSE